MQRDLIIEAFSREIEALAKMRSVNGTNFIQLFIAQKEKVSPYPYAGITHHAELPPSHEGGSSAHFVFELILMGKKELPSNLATNRTPATEIP